MARLFRAYVGDLPRISPDEPVELSEEEAHHVRRVLRLAPGDALSAFDGRGREWEAELIDSPPGAARLRLGAERHDPVEPPIAIVLFQGLCRPERMEWVIQKATECGVTAVHPLAAERAVAIRLSDQRLKRWRRVALEATKQSGRRRIPTIEPADTLPEPAAGEVALLLDPADGQPLAERLDAASPGTVLLAVGPESGFSDAERSAAVAAGWQPTALGPRTLRTETAGLVAAAVVLHRWGDVGRA